jgi:serine/threonine-protein kinase
VPVLAAGDAQQRPRTVAGPPAKVEFAAHEFFFVWIKVGGREQALEPTAELSLPPGRHKVMLRERAGDPWLSAGRIDVEPGKRYRVSLRKPHSLTVARKD